MTDRWLLTPLEEYFLLEDRHAYPWSFFVRLGFLGCADRPATETALNRCVLGHPLLSSIAQRQSNGSWAWRPVEHPQPVVRWTTESAEPAYASATHLDVSTEIGIRLQVHVGTNHTQLTFQFHHACCDGRGAFSVVEDWLAEYARGTGDERVSGWSRSYTPDMLERRDQPVAKPRQPLGAFAARWAGLLRAYRFFVQQPAPLLDYQPASDKELTPVGFPAARNFRFDAGTTAEIRSVAKRQGVTVNDLLCRDLFLALQGFRRELQPPASDGWLRLAVPVDLRTPAQANMSAANQASLVFLTRQASTCGDADALLQGIHREMQQVKTWGLARTFLRSLHIRRYLPGGLARSVRNGKCGATAALTNVGETLGTSQLPRLGGRLVAGNLTLDAADFLAPIRPLTCASFSSCTYAGRLSISVQYDPRALSERTADRLFDVFLEQVRSGLR